MLGSSVVASQLAMAEVEPWSPDAVLYQPIEELQILLAENASCLAVKTFLKMCGLPCEIQTRQNAEHMSPGGRLTKLPLIRCGAFVVSEFHPIVNLVESKGISLSQHLDEDQKIELRAYLSLVENIFTNAELYISWLDPLVLEQVTKPRNGSVYSWPLNHIQNFMKARHVRKQLDIYGWKDVTMEDVVEKISKCCETLSDLLKDQDYFYGDKPTELDALAFGHFYIILTTKLPNNKLAETIKEFPNLSQFSKRIEKIFFG